jgi:hypothetical protein
VRFGGLCFLLVLAGFVLFPAVDVAGIAVVLVAVCALPVLAYRDGGWRGLRWSGLVPLAAFAADVMTFTPWSFQPSSDPTIYTPIAIYYLPVWVLLTAPGIASRRVRHRVPRQAPPIAD